MGYWFYETTSEEKRASFFASWGLLEIAPVVTETPKFAFIRIFRSRRR